MGTQANGIDVQRSEERFRSERDGIVTLHSFSYGTHFDAGRMGFGPIIAINEEQVPPAGGYETHHHADVEIVTWVLAGALAHEDTAGACGVIEPGTLYWLTAGDGVQHSEHNASVEEPLCFIQTMLRSEFDGEATHQADASGWLDLGGRAPIDVTLLRRGQTLTLDRPALVHVTAGTVRIGDIEGAIDFGPGDEARIRTTGPYDLSASDNAGAMVWQLQG